MKRCILALLSLLSLLSILSVNANINGCVITPGIKSILIECTFPSSNHFDDYIIDWYGFNNTICSSRNGRWEVYRKEYYNSTSIFCYSVELEASEWLQCAQVEDVGTQNVGLVAYDVNRTFQIIYPMTITRKLDDWSVILKETISHIDQYLHISEVRWSGQQGSFCPSFMLEIMVEDMIESAEFVQIISLDHTVSVVNSIDIPYNQKKIVVNSCSNLHSSYINMTAVVYSKKELNGIYHNFSIHISPFFSILMENPVISGNLYEVKAKTPDSVVWGPSFIHIIISPNFVHNIYLKYMKKNLAHYPHHHLPKIEHLSITEYDEPAYHKRYRTWILIGEGSLSTDDILKPNIISSYNTNEVWDSHVDSFELFTLNVSFFLPVMSPHKTKYYIDMRMSPDNIIGDNINSGYHSTLFFEMNGCLVGEEYHPNTYMCIPITYPKVMCVVVPLFVSVIICVVIRIIKRRDFIKNFRTLRVLRLSRTSTNKDEK